MEPGAPQSHHCRERRRGVSTEDALVAQRLGARSARAFPPNVGKRNEGRSPRMPSVPGAMTSTRPACAHLTDHGGESVTRIRTAGTCPKCGERYFPPMRNEPFSPVQWRRDSKGILLHWGVGCRFARPVASSKSFSACPSVPKRLLDSAKQSVGGLRNSNRSKLAIPGTKQQTRERTRVAWPSARMERYFP